MIDILALLDQTIEDLQREGACSTSREKWRKPSKLPVAPAIEGLTGTGNPLSNNELPVLPVVPVPKQETCVLNTKTEEKTDHQNRQKEILSHEYLSKSTGSTGSTGSREGFCGPNTPREGIGSGGGTGRTGSREDLYRFAGDQDLIHTSEEQAATVEPPLLLLDGRRLHRFRADAIPATVPGHARELCDQARSHGAVLVADGHDLIVVEPWRSALALEMLQTLKDAAGAIIAHLRGESRDRCTRQEDESHNE
jgi:hypothetical protein